MQNQLGLHELRFADFVGELSLPSFEESSCNNVMFYGLDLFSKT